VKYDQVTNVCAKRNKAAIKTAVGWSEASGLGVKQNEAKRSKTKGKSAMKLGGEDEVKTK
jgi:hypothetical protein